MCGRRPSGSGFTLAETLVVVVVIGLLTTILAGGFGGMLPAGRQEAALGKARILNAARCAYALVDPDAAQRWTDAADDGARFQLLVDAQVIDGSAASYLRSQGGYTLSLEGPVRSSTLVYRDGTPLAYENGG